MSLPREDKGWRYDGTTVLRDFRQQAPSADARLGTGVSAEWNQLLPGALALEGLLLEPLFSDEPGAFDLPASGAPVLRYGVVSVSRRCS